jgi:hypothetical protein
MLEAGASRILFPCENELVLKGILLANHSFQGGSSK